MTSAAVKFVPTTPNMKQGELYVGSSRTSIIGSSPSTIAAVNIPNAASIGQMNVSMSKPNASLKSVTPQRFQAPVRSIVKPLTKPLPAGTVALGPALSTKQFLSPGGALTEHHIVSVKQNPIGNPPIILSTSNAPTPT